MSLVRENFAAAGLPLDVVTAAREARHPSLAPQLFDVLVDVKSISTMLNSITSGEMIDIGTFEEMLISICYRLMRFRPLHVPWRRATTEAAYHIGLTMFTMSFFLQNERRRVPVRDSKQQAM